MCGRAVRFTSIVVGLGLALCWLPPVNAHDGQPYPLLVDTRIGPSLVSVWADPEVGTGTFFIRLEPLPESKLPDDIAVHVGVQPVSGRLAAVRYPAQREALHGYVQYKAEVSFDAQELWRVRILMDSSAGSGEVVADVQVTPPGLGRWDVLFYLFPFLAVGGLGVLTIKMRRRC